MPSYPHTSVLFDRSDRKVHHPPRVLIVDDNHSGADSLSAYLDILGFTCHVAYGGNDAITVAKNVALDVIVMDITMPVCNGFQAAIALRKHQSTAHITIIAFTALDEIDVKKELKDHEFDAYCQKGQSPEVLIKLIKSLAPADVQG